MNSIEESVRCFRYRLGFYETATKTRPLRSHITNAAIRLSMDAIMKPIRTVRCQVVRWETARFRSEWTLLNIFCVDSGTDYFSTKQQRKPVLLARTLLTQQSAGYGCDNDAHPHWWMPSSRMRNFSLPISMNYFENLLKQASSTDEFSTRRK